MPTECLFARRIELQNRVRICAVIVTYRPASSRLSLLLLSLVQQVDEIVVVDNGSSSEILTWFSDFKSEVPIKVFPLGKNKGIAFAQNIGIQYAKQRSADYVILFDHDSEPAPDMLQKLREVALAKMSNGLAVGAVAPIYRSAEDDTLSGFVRLGWFGFERVYCTQPGDVVEADFLIASGSLIPMTTIAAVGGMEEGLFIDHVDTEWCLRAKSKGFHLYGACGALMTHQLGERRKRVWFLRWRSVPYHSPFRYYYIFRNSMRLLRRPYMPLRWKVADMARCLRSIIFFGLFSSERLACLKMMYRGFKDGLKGVDGEMP